jgi:hypothetical protein
MSISMTQFLHVLIVGLLFSLQSKQVHLLFGKLSIDFSIRQTLHVFTFLKALCPIGHMRHTYPLASLQ